MEPDKQAKACSGLGTNIDARELSATAGSVAYQGQAHVEGGFRFLKEPLLFVSSLFVKKPTWIDELLMVMTLALLVYSVAQRRLRKHGAENHATLPHHINQPPPSPTFRWGFQLLEGMHRVQVTVHGQVRDLIEGLRDVQIKILRLVGHAVCHLYQMSTGEGAQCRIDLMLNLDVPGTGDTGIELVGEIFTCRQGHWRELVRAAMQPQGGMRIQQQPHGV
jgi:hypothetical protein